MTTQDEDVVQRKNKRVAKIQKMKGNEVCADCPTKNPCWVSFLKDGPEDDGHSNKNLKVEGFFCALICDTCAPHHHFELGKEYSSMKYLKYAHEWSNEELDCVEKSGNYVVNKCYEALKIKYDKNTINPNHEEEDADRGKFIHKKYVKKKFLDETVLEKTLDKLFGKRRGSTSKDKDKDKIRRSSSTDSSGKDKDKDKMRRSYSTDSGKDHHHHHHHHDRSSTSSKRESHSSSNKDRSRSSSHDRDHYHQHHHKDKHGKDSSSSGDHEKRSSNSRKEDDNKNKKKSDDDKREKSHRDSSSNKHRSISPKRSERSSSHHHKDKKDQHRDKDDKPHRDSTSSSSSKQQDDNKINGNNKEPPPPEPRPVTTPYSGLASLVEKKKEDTASSASTQRRMSQSEQRLKNLVDAKKMQKLQEGMAKASAGLADEGEKLCPTTTTGASGGAGGSISTVGLGIGKIAKVSNLHNPVPAAVDPNKLNKLAEKMAQAKSNVTDGLASLVPPDGGGERGDNIKKGLSPSVRKLASNPDLQKLLKQSSNK